MTVVLTPPSQEVALAAVRSLLLVVGEDPGREGLQDTPGRVCRALVEMTRGYGMNAEEILATTFDEFCDQMVVVSGVRFASLCEHHMLPFTGHATVGYIPRTRVVGLSKLARLVEMFACRLQVQERMTFEIADAISAYLDPIGVGVVVAAHHACMGSRGARQPDGVMTTSALAGAMRDKPEARAEFLALARTEGGRP